MNERFTFFKKIYDEKGKDMPLHQYSKLKAIQKERSTRNISSTEVQGVKVGNYQKSQYRRE